MGAWGPGLGDILIDRDKGFIKLAVACPLLDIPCQCCWSASPKIPAGTLRWYWVSGWQWGALALSRPSGYSALTSLETQKGNTGFLWDLSAISRSLMRGCVSNVLFCPSVSSVNMKSWWGQFSKNQLRRDHWVCYWHLWWFSFYFALVPTSRFALTERIYFCFVVMQQAAVLNTLKLEPLPEDGYPPFCFWGPDLFFSTWHDEITVTSNVRAGPLNTAFKCL